MAKAIVYDRFGGPEVLRLSEVPVPKPAEGQVRVLVRAAGVNPLDWKVIRAVFGGQPPTSPQGLGVELAGVVDAVGDNVSAFAVGDEVLGRPIGNAGYAEFALARPADLVRKPAELSWELAGGLTVAAETGYRALVTLGVSAGDTVLIHGASGAVGVVTTQLAIARGARVIGTASERNHDFLRALGATPVAYGDGWVDRVRAVGGTVDAVLDAAGKGVLPESVELAGGADRVITIADSAGAQAAGVVFTGGAEDMLPLSDVFAEVFPLLANGKLQLPIAGTYPLARAADALAESEAGHAGGKLVLLP